MKYEFQGISMTMGKNGKYIIHDEKTVESYVTFNPILATQCFATLIESEMRNRVGNYLKCQGKNPYTGCNVNISCDKCRRLRYYSQEGSHCTLECTCEKVVDYGDIQLQ